MKIKIQKIKRQKKISKKGNEYQSVGIASNGEWYNGFGDPLTDTWKEGDPVEIKVEEKNGFKNFTPIPMDNESVMDMVQDVFPNAVIEEKKEKKDRVYLIIEEIKEMIKLPVIDARDALDKREVVTTYMGNMIEMENVCRLDYQRKYVERKKAQAEKDINEYGFREEEIKLEARHRRVKGYIAWIDQILINLSHEIRLKEQEQIRNNL